MLPHSYSQKAATLVTGDKLIARDTTVPNKTNQNLGHHQTSHISTRRPHTSNINLMNSEASFTHYFFFLRNAQAILKTKEKKKSQSLCGLEALFLPPLCR